MAKDKVSNNQNSSNNSDTSKSPMTFMLYTATLIFYAYTLVILSYAKNSHSQSKEDFELKLAEHSFFLGTFTLMLAIISNLVDKGIVNELISSYLGSEVHTSLELSLNNYGTPNNNDEVETTGQLTL